MTENKKNQESFEHGDSQNGVKSDVRLIVPPVDIQETAESYILRLDIPGADKKNISAQINDDTLSVSARVDSYFEKDTALFYDNSMPMEYRREFSLANDVDTTAVNALYDLGVLTLTLKKKQQCLPKEIEVM